MFNKCLNDLTLAGNLADNIFANISASAYQNDGTMIAVMRALLVPRTKENVRGRLYSLTYGAAVIRDNDLKTIMNAHYSENLLRHTNQLFITDVKSPADRDRNALFDKIDDADHGFVKTYPSFEEMANIRDFVAPVMRARFYTDMEHKVTAVFVEQLNLRKFHYLMSFMPRYFKWFFQDKPFTEDEKQLLKGLTMRTCEEFVSRIEKIAEQYDMRKYLIENVFGQIEKRARKQQLENSEHQIESIRSQIEDCLNAYRDLMRSLDDQNVRHAGLIEIINGADDDSKLVSYLKCNKNIEPIGVSGSRYDFIVKTTWDSWDPEQFATMKDKSNSGLYVGYSIRHGEFSDWEVRRRFFEAILGDEPVLKVKICAYYSLDTYGDSTSMSGYDYPRSCDDMIPNPHLQHYNCLGNHQMLINEYLRKGDNVGAVEQCVASAKSINLGEHMTYSHLFEELFRTNAKVIQLPDGTSVSPVEALKWLDEQDKKGESEDA